MKKNIAIVSLLAVSIKSALAGPVSPENSLPKDTTKVIDIEEVVVIATPKENNRLRQQATSSTSFSQSAMRNNSVTSVKSLSALVPNLFIPDYGSKLTTSVYIRGIGSRINTPAVGLYVDNIPFIDKSAFDFNYSDIERIDVMRGPQGTLYGRNTMGGLIRVFTKSPFTYQGTDLRLGAATYNNYNASLTHYHRISNQFAFSVGLFYDHKGGFFKNDFNGKRIDTDNEFGGRIRAIYLPTENLKLDFTVNYEYANQGGYPYEYTGKVKGEEDRAEYIGRISYDNACGYKRNLLNTGVNLEYQADNFILSSVTGFQYLRDHMDLDQDFTEQNIYTMMQKQNSKTLSEEIVLKSKPGRRWQWTTGVSGFYQWLDTEAPVTFQKDGVNWLNSTINTNANKYMPTISMGPMSMKLNFNDVINGEQLAIPGKFSTPILNGAIFHQSTFNDLFGLEGLSFTAGLRMDYESLKLDYYSGCQFTHTYSLSGTLTPANKVIAMIPAQEFNVNNSYDGKLSHDYIQLLPKFALQYDFDSRNNIYASVSKGYRSGGYNIQMFSDLLQSSLKNDMMRQTKEEILKAVEGSPSASYKDLINEMFPDAGENPDARSATEYKPEQTWNYEIGTHLNLFNNRLRTDAALFWLETRDQQISRFAGASGLGRETVNAGKSRSLGAELSLAAAITADFTLNTSYGYTYATFKDYVTNARVNGQLQEISYNGNYVPFVPKHTLTVGGQYIFRINPGYWLERIQLNAGYTGAGRVYWTEENTVSQSFYGTLNGRISFQKGRGQIDFWVRNALDKDYAAFYFESMGNGFMQKGRSIQAGIELRCRF